MFSTFSAGVHMQFPMLVISYGDAKNNKLFFYEVAGIGCMPIFTDPTVASLFLDSVCDLMRDMLVGKPELQIVACSHKSHALDMFRNIAVFVKGVNVVDLNPSPLTDSHKEKLVAYETPYKSHKYELAEMIDLIQQEK